jgi:hypothetical protein
MGPPAAMYTTSTVGPALPYFMPTSADITAPAAVAPAIAPSIATRASRPRPAHRYAGTKGSAPAAYRNDDARTTLPPRRLTNRNARFMNATVSDANTMARTGNMPKGPPHRPAAAPPGRAGAKPQAVPNCSHAARACGPPRRFVMDGTVGIRHFPRPRPRAMQASMIS